MLKRLLIFATVGLLALPAAVLAQQPNFVTGDRTFTISGAGSSDKDFDASRFEVEASLGMFLTDFIEASVRQGFGYFDPAVGNSDWTASTRVAADFYIPIMSHIQPLIGANVGYLYGDRLRDQWVLGPEIGLKAFVNDTTYISGLVEYQVLFRSAEDVDDQFRHGRWVYTVGVGFKF